MRSSGTTGVPPMRVLNTLPHLGSQPACNAGHATTRGSGGKPHPANVNRKTVRTGDTPAAPAAAAGSGDGPDRDRVVVARFAHWYNTATMNFEVVGGITDMETFAVGASIRELPRLRRAGIRRWSLAEAKGRRPCPPRRWLDMPGGGPLVRGPRYRSRGNEDQAVLGRLTWHAASRTSSSSCV